MSEQKINWDFISHALGADFDRRKNSELSKDKTLPQEFSRNYFLAGYKDVADWEYLVEIGYATKRFRTIGEEEYKYFYVSEKGILEFRLYFRREVIDKFIEPKKSRENYILFKYGEYDCTFAEYLGIYVPKLETKGTWRKYKYRYYSTNPKHIGRGFGFNKSSVCGEWCKTQKEAKASYKEALKKYKANVR